MRPDASGNLVDTVIPTTATDELPHVMERIV
jgi:hypothetical protein